mmetsp:Transcript_100076/g.282476  ORF Transcript_100076/g.282476 Transcript_100076/m.282476 type:complete len:191 (+) Transcript_100076:74-646(+)
MFAARALLCRPTAVRRASKFVPLGSVAPQASVALFGPRAFAAVASPLQTASKLYADLVDKSVKEFHANKQAVAADLDAELAANRLVLFMEGTPDAPKSEPSMNAVKMLTQAQAVPILAVDVLAHPTILGYAVTKSGGKLRGPHLYVDGNFYADHDGLLAKHKSGELVKAIGTTATLSTGTFAGELPIATY